MLWIEPGSSADQANGLHPTMDVTHYITFFRLHYTGGKCVEPAQLQKLPK